MTKVFDDGFICLEDTDYAAIPLALQANAALTDTTLKTINNSLVAYNNRPWAQAITTANAVQVNSVDGFIRGEPPPGLQLQFTAATATTFGITGFPTMTLPPRGWYLAGFTATFQATGAVTLNSMRTMGLSWAYAINGVNQWDQQAAHDIVESNTAGDSGTVAGMFFADGLRNYTLIPSFNHRNTGSTMQVNSGARYWVSYLGTGLVI